MFECVPTLLTLLPTTPHPTPKMSQSTKLSSLYYTAASHWLSDLHVVGYIGQCCFLSLSHPLLPRCAHKFDLYIYIFI